MCYRKLESNFLHTFPLLDCVCSFWFMGPPAAAVNRALAPAAFVLFPTKSTNVSVGVRSVT
jgi:hypothetical protein